VIPHPDPVSPVTADGTVLPKVEELYQSETGTSPLIPGSVTSVSVNSALPLPTSTDRPAVPDTGNDTRVADRRAPAAGVGFAVTANADGADTTIPVTTPTVVANTAPAAARRRAGGGETGKRAAPNHANEPQEPSRRTKERNGLITVCRQTAT
jgi:hypothetical protein